MLSARLISMLLQAFLRPGITTPKTNPDPLTGIEQDGALIPNAAMLTALRALHATASPTFGNWGQTLIPNSLSARTYGGGEMSQGLIRRFGTGSAITDCTDTATNIVNAIPGAKVNQTFPFFLANMGAGNDLTLAAGTGVTIAGTAVVSALSMRLFLGQVTGSAAVTITSLFQFPLRSNL